MPLCCWPSASRFTAPPLTVIGTTPDGLPSVISSRLAPVLTSIERTLTWASWNVSVAAPLLAEMLQGKVEFRWMSRMKLRLRKTQKDVLHWEICSLPFDLSRLTSGFGPEYSMWARYSSPSPAAPSMEIRAEPTSTSMEAWSRLPTLADVSSM